MGFNSWQDFVSFEENVKYKNRFIHSQDVTEFLSNIKRTLPDRKISLAVKTPLFRAQIGHDEDECEGSIRAIGYPAERMKPVPNKGAEGRANPKGISYLYLADDKNTSLAELRPNIGQRMSSAEFKVNRDLNIINCYSVSKYYNYAECVFNTPLTQEDITNAIWSMINDAFTKPVTNNDSTSDYVPTQFLAELFKSEGFHGVCFKSGMGEGCNFILFDLNDADFVGCTVMEAKSVKYDFIKTDSF
jgi:hypothetical protein